MSWTWKVTPGGGGAGKGVGLMSVPTKVCDAPSDRVGRSERRSRSQVPELTGYYNENANGRLYVPSAVALSRTFTG